MPGNSTSGEQRCRLNTSYVKLRAAINMRWAVPWPDNQAQISYAAATCMMRRKGYQATLQNICTEMNAQGISCKSLGLNQRDVRAVLQNQRYFCEVSGNDARTTEYVVVQLDADSLCEDTQETRDNCKVYNDIAVQQQQCQQQQELTSNPFSRETRLTGPRQHQQYSTSQQVASSYQPKQLQHQLFEMQITHDAVSGRCSAAFKRISQAIHNNSVAAAEADTAKTGFACCVEDEAVASLLHLLPKSVQQSVSKHLPATSSPALIELHADASCNVMAKLSDGSIHELPCKLNISSALKLLAASKRSSSGVNDGSSSSSGSDVQQPELFSSDNRSGVPGMLHRISAMRDRQHKVVGLTYRVGRHIPGVALRLADVLSSMAASIRDVGAADRPQSLLLLGRPGVGKTTLLRDIARLFSLPPSQGGLGLAVVIVDTSNEIAGDCAARHPCVGRARRMMVPNRREQARVLVEAVQNHCPDVIIVDEIGTPEEVAAARTISQRGVLLVGTAHGTQLGDLLRNKELAPLVGGVSPVTLGDQQATSSNGGRKVRLERSGAATFVSLVELQDRNRWCLHTNAEESVDALLQYQQQEQHQQLSPQHPRQRRSNQKQLQPDIQLRSIDAAGRWLVEFQSAAAAARVAAAAAASEVGGFANGKQLVGSKRGRETGSVVQQDFAAVEQPTSHKKKKQKTAQPGQRMSMPRRSARIRDGSRA